MTVKVKTPFFDNQKRVLQALLRHFLPPVQERTKSTTAAIKMSRISEIMTLIEFPREAADYFEEVFAKVEGDKALMSQLEALEAQYYESFNSEDLENKLKQLSEASGFCRTPRVHLCFF